MDTHSGLMAVVAFYNMLLSLIVNIYHGSTDFTLDQGRRILTGRIEYTGRTEPTTRIKASAHAHYGGQLISLLFKWKVYQTLAEDDILRMFQS